MGFKKCFVTGPDAGIRLQHDQTALFIRNLQNCRRPLLNTRLKVLHDCQSTLNHQGRLPGQDAGNFAEFGFCGWRTLEIFPEIFSFITVLVAMVHKSLPAYEN